jgi:hypothetical protein
MKHEAVTVVVYPASPLLLGRNWLHIVLETAPIYTVKVVRKPRVKGIVTIIATVRLTVYSSHLTGFNCSFRL